jgi:hypothetical protein
VAVIRAVPSAIAETFPLADTVTMSGSIGAPFDQTDP